MSINFFLFISLSRMSALEVEKGYHWNHRYNICDQIFFSLDNVWTALYKLLNKFLQLKTLISRNVYSAAIINVFQSELSDFEINVPHCLKKYRNDESYTVWSREGHQGILVHPLLPVPNFHYHSSMSWILLHNNAFSLNTVF